MFCVILVLIACIAHELMLSCENLVLSHLSPTSNGLSREILFQIACVAHELSMKFVVRF